jgi:hypothetical protein
MNPNPENIAPTAADYRALIDRFNTAAHAHNSGEIDFPSFRQLIAQIEDETRILTFRRKLERAYRSIARDQKTSPKAP